MKNRDNAIDTAKGIGIILVVLGHTYNIPSILYAFIYSFHMPLFFMLAGFVYNEKKYNQLSFRTFFVKKAKSYLLPYLILSFVNLFLLFLFNLIFKRSLITKSELKTYLLGILSCTANIQNMPNCSPIWFLMCLFFVSLMFWLIVKYIRKKYMIFVAIVFALISYILSLLLSFSLPLRIAPSFMGVFFMTIGYLLKNSYPFSNWNMLLFIPGVIASYLNGSNVSMTDNQYGNILLFLISSITLSLSIITFIKLCPFLQNTFLTWLGKNTIIIFGFNYFFRDFTTELYYLFPFIRNHKIHWIISFLLTFTFCVFASFLWFKFKCMLQSKQHNTTTKSNKLI